MTVSNGRGGWDSELQFLLTSVGYAVGLGNLWRFPSVAYENGGGAFLIPYLCCSIVMGLPLLYMEFFIGQYTQNGAAVAYRNYMPVLQGIGWTSTVCSFMIGIYYNVIIVYCLLYLYNIVFSDVSTWTTCGNAWNTENCMLLNETRENGTLAADEFYLHNILKVSDSIDTVGSLNLPLLIGLIFIWSLTALSLIKGVKIIGKMSYFTATMPYIIIGFFFVLVLTLDGASVGLSYYLLQPNFEKLLDFNTWIAAASQLCFSLSIGFGGLLSLSSYNNRKHNCLKDAILIVFCDGFMSIFGGCVIFAILGFLSVEVGKPIEELIQSKGGIAFVVYPEAFARLSGTSILNFLLFFMFFLLGISSQFGTMQPMLTSIMDQFPSLRNKSELIAFVSCFISFLAGLSMCWQVRILIFFFLIISFSNGNYWLNLYNNWIGANTIFIVCLAELIIIIFCYGIRNFMEDIEECMGSAKTVFGRIFGKTGYYFKVCWTIIAPVLITILLITSAVKQVTTIDDIIEGPEWMVFIAFFLQYFPLIFVPIFAIVNIRYFMNTKEGAGAAFRVQPSLLSFKRVSKKLEKIYTVETSTVTNMA